MRRAAGALWRVAVWAGGGFVLGYMLCILLAAWSDRAAVESAGVLMLGGVVAGMAGGVAAEVRRGSGRR